MPVGASAFVSSRLGVSLGLQLGRLIKSHGGAAYSSPLLLLVPPRLHGRAGPPSLSSVVSAPLGGTAHCQDAPGRHWVGSSRQVGGVRARQVRQARGRRGKGATALGASIDVARR